MDKILKIASITICSAFLWVFSACSDDFLMDEQGAHGVDMNNMVEVEIPFGLGKGLTSHIVTRADGTTDQTGKDSQLSGIMVFVYENTGKAETDKLVSFQLFESPLTSLDGSTGGWTPDRTDYTQGHFKLYLPVGNVYIYLIGNATGSFFDFFPDVKDKKMETRQEFIDYATPKWNGNMFTVDGYLPLVGTVNNSSGACKIEESLNGTGILSYVDNQGETHHIGQEEGSEITADNSFVLKRLMCKISMEFKNKEGVTFTPKSYKFRHCSNYVPLAQESWEGAFRYGLTRDTETVIFDAQTPNSFTVYLPENIREYTGDKTDLTFADRDKVKKDDDGKNKTEEMKGIGPDNEEQQITHYDFEKAPSKSTYVEITGKFEGEGISADTKYILHLGDFSDNKFNEFSLRRDYHYQYTVTVNGVNDIVVEVKGDKGDPYENNPAVEGIVFEGGARVQLDAHYEQVEMKLKQSDMANGVYIYAQTPFGDVSCKYLPASQTLEAGSYDEEYGTPEEALDKFKKLLQWIEFKKQNGKGNLATYAREKMDVFAALDHAYRNTEQNDYYTCFVDEYYYTRNPLGGSISLKDFINAEDRTFSLGSQITYSADKQSAVASAVYVLQQHSIACFYDLNDMNKAKYGVELIDEIGDLGKQKLPYGDPVQESSDAKTGRENTLLEINGKNNAVDWTKNGFLLNADDTRLEPGKGRLTEKSAYLACLTRNRDFNGNDRIDDDELRWYTPARDQMLGLWIGEPALPAKAALYPYPTSQLDADAGKCQWPIFTSTNGEGRLVWAEQGCSFGTKDAAAEGGYVRAVRNLGATPSENSYTEKADAYYFYNPADRTIGVSLTSNALRAFSNRELAPHNERSVTNRPYRKFQVAAHPYVVEDVKVTCKGHGLWPQEVTRHYTQLQTTDERRAKTDITTIASKYTGEESGISNATWRLPNQREIALMIVAMGTDLGYTNNEYNHWDYKCDGSWRHEWKYSDTYILHCRTSFSKENYSPGFLGYMYNTKDKKMQMMHATGGAGATGIAGYLCVRDVMQ